MLKEEHLIEIVYNEMEAIVVSVCVLVSSGMRPHGLSSGLLGSDVNGLSHRGLTNGFP